MTQLHMVKIGRPVDVKPIASNVERSLAPGCVRLFKIIFLFYFLNFHFIRDKINCSTNAKSS